MNLVHVKTLKFYVKRYTDILLAYSVLSVRILQTLSNKESLPIINVLFLWDESLVISDIGG